MRQLADFSDALAAERLAGFLTANGIEAEAREADGGNHRVWVYDEDQLRQAERHLQEYLKNPDDPKYERARPKKVEPPADRHRQVDVRTEVFARGQGADASLTMALIVISVVLTLLSWSDDFKGFTYNLYYSEYIARDFREILSGQVWRIFTPIFLHGDILHLFFNMLWLWQLGGQIETTERTRTLFALVLVSAAICNTGQYLVSGPAFLGMSGVVYALLGYIWMMAKYAPASGYMLHKQIVGFMLIWLVLCLVGVIPGAANTEHVAGILTGVIWGFLKAGGPRTMARKREWKKKTEGL